MVALKKYIRLLKATGCGVVMTGGTWVCFQIYQTYNNINHLIKVDVLDVERRRAEYIYIHDPHFKDKTSLMHNEYESDVKNNSTYDVFEVPMRWWKSWNHSYGWRLLSMASNGDRYDRLQAVYTLATLKSLSGSDLRQLAQVCDGRTAVGLARTEGVDLRFFLPPPYNHIIPNKQQLTARLHMFLNAVNKENNHICIQYFLRKAFPNLHQKHLNFLDDLTATEVHKRPIRDEDILPLCIESLLHHSCIDDNAKAIVRLGGLPILMDSYKYFKDDMDVLIMLGEVISNISLHAEMLHDIFISGWVGVLAAWSQHDDVRLSAPAVRALANLDQDDRLQGQYGRRVYLLHPADRRWETPRIDVVFVHGLLGGVFITWRQRDLPFADKFRTATVRDILERDVSDEKTKEYLQNVSEIKQRQWEEVLQEYELVMDDCPESSNRSARGPYTYPCDERFCQQSCVDRECYTHCWPKDWLPSDCRYLRIIGVNYDTSISEWATMCPSQKMKRSLDERSDELLKNLKLAGIGSRPVVWVSHSMGGLLVKNILVKAWESGDLATERMCTQTRGVVFYSVPHHGSPLAALRQATTLLLWPSVEVQELRENSPSLLLLHERFLRMIQEVPMEVISFAETLPTKVSSMPSLQYNFVPLSSADLGFGEFFAIPQDHLSICKPANRQSFLYQKLLQLIRGCDPSSQP